ncbi:uncharacterized protein MONOS_7213 [Monocercomonoides exilis]|uniref:uncharacterized protein n=1 Tax=Monocercomonoides exilis TaxID=2049356 RepID=UPI00355A988B|nr:hypothetical protein MONOS_7213 [Monocercomonoides exilis]|eukprot:MONOS_7213.1-p1 / transcript=MONOS_7213.1 / gene=MONOS_7213 / organism=Monocercomonoides_exilis_PA203 / gene_product=unspecified product / transcript_product=unspecified product / location=Mono_scaffold00241:38593-40129(-) / protein_length=187 / sequence_SO=supercontig / SO=protein_coding / is_pseudo=false
MMNALDLEGKILKTDFKHSPEIAGSEEQSAEHESHAVRCVVDLRAVEHRDEEWGRVVSGDAVEGASAVEEPQGGGGEESIARPEGGDGEAVVGEFAAVDTDAACSCRECAQLYARDEHRRGSTEGVEVGIGEKEIGIRESTKSRAGEVEGMFRYVGEVKGASARTKMGGVEADELVSRGKEEGGHS